MKRLLAVSLVLLILLLASCSQSRTSGGSKAEPTDSPIQKQTFKQKNSDGSPVFSVKTVINGSTPADKPAAPGDLYSSPDNSAKDDTKVIISGVTAQAKPGDSIVIEGENFTGKNQKVFIYYGT